MTYERIRQILTAAAEVAGLKKKLSPHWLRHAHGSHAHQRGARSDDSRYARACVPQDHGPLPGCISSRPRSFRETHNCNRTAVMALGARGVKSEGGQVR